MVKVLTEEGQEVFNKLKKLEDLWYPEDVPNAHELFAEMDRLSNDVEIEDGIPESWKRKIDMAIRLKKQGKTNKEIMDLLFNRPNI